MAKIALSKIDIVNTETNGKLSYMASQTPWTSSVGHVWLQGPNALGVAQLQANGYKVYSEPEWNDLLCKTFGLSKEAVGNRGPSWSTPADREKYKVYINDVEFKPALSEKALKRAEMLEIQKKAKAEIVVAPVAVAVADTTPAINEAEIIGKIKSAIAGKHTKEVILTALQKKVSQAKAVELYNRATAPAQVVIEPIF